MRQLVNNNHTVQVHTNKIHRCETKSVVMICSKTLIFLLYILLNMVNTDHQSNATDQLIQKHS